MNRYILMTGATGLLGQYLVRDLLLRGHRFALVVRPGRKESIQDRLETILQMWERQCGQMLPRPVCIEGDVSAEKLGLSSDSRAWIAHNCDRILHNAAVLVFYGEDRNGEPWRTNFKGTQNVLDVCRETGIEEMHYVSTAYVCGTRNGLIMEDDFEEPADFRNDYEKSKYESERLVRETDVIKKLTVYRPGVIVGDSKTGYTATYHGLGMYLKLMSVMIGNLQPDENGVRHTPLYLPCTGDEPRNTIPVDWVSAVMARLFNNPEAHGGTYHITPDEPFTARQLIESCEDYFNATGTVFNSSDIGLNDFDKLSHEHLSIYHAYLTTDPEFDTSNLKKFVPDLPNPKIDREMIHRFLRYGEQDRWGKRRKKRSEPTFWVRDLLRLSVVDGITAKPCDESASRDANCFGLDVWGVGGGQFCLQMIGDSLVRVTEGLPVDGSPILQMSIFDLGRRLGIDMSALKDFSAVKFENAPRTHSDEELCKKIIGALTAIGESQDLFNGPRVANATDASVEQRGDSLPIVEVTVD